MSTTWKIAIAVITTAVVAVGVVFLLQQKGILSPKAQQNNIDITGGNGTNNVPNNESASGAQNDIGTDQDLYKNIEIGFNELNTSQTAKTFQDATAGVSFLVPPGWKVSYNENNDIYVYRENPYLSVVFVSQNKKDWDADKKGMDILVEAGTTVVKDATVDGHPAQLFQSGKSGDFGTSGDYYVDSVYWHIATADPTLPEIMQIVKSIKF